MTATTPSRAASSRRRFDWFGVACAAVIWGVFVGEWALDVESFAAFLVMVGTYLIMTLVLLGWWFTRKQFTLGQRFLVPVAAALLGVIAIALTASAIKPPIYVVLFGLPIVMTAWAIWVLRESRRERRPRVGGLIACFVVIGAAFPLMRVNGTHGNMRADLHWRWTPTAEEMYLAQRPQSAGPTTVPTERQIELQPGDWPGFRGPRRDGVVRGLTISTDWAQSPPAVLWRQRVGPAWSSMAVVDGCVFTQEQRGPREAVVCRDANTGRETWAHEDAARFDEAMSGPGPRATPTFANGRIYAQGALGTLSCLDAATGRLIWSRDVRADSGAAVPMWAFSNSPLVTGDRVIVFAGGEGKKSLLAYPLDGGAPLWTADAGKVSYASPQQVESGPQQAVAMFTTEGFFGIDGKTGHVLWQYPIEPGVGVPAVVQACQTNASTFVLGAGAAFGLQRVHVSGDGKSAARDWITRKMKPSFSDMVYHDGFIYGFDGTVFCCMDATTGERRWRDGRYGAGQVLLLADQGVMIVTSEEGEAILLRCNPQKNEELGRVPAITGKTWNHPAIAGDRLYVRSDAEMGCLQLKAIDRRPITVGGIEASR